MYYSTYLAHHGILGMKWGVRRYQNKDGSLTPAGRTRYNLDLQKGTKVYRVARSATDASSKDYRYVSTTQEQRDFYKGHMGEELRGYEGDHSSKLDVYEHEYETQVDLVAPDLKTRKDVIMALSKANIDVASEVGRAFVEQNLSEFGTASKDFVEKQMKDPHTQRAVQEVITRYRNAVQSGNKDEAFSMFTWALQNSKENMNRYIDSLKKLGYNCVIDDEGRGRIRSDSEATTDLIVFDVSSTLGNRTSSKLTMEEEAAARERIYQANLAKRKNKK